jgi:hypothetical protein
MDTFDVSEGLLVAPQALQRLRARGERLNIVGPQLVAQIEVKQCLLETRRLTQEDRGLARGVPKAGLKFKRALKAEDSFVIAAQLSQRQSETTPQLRVVGLEFDRSFECLERVGASALLQKRGPKRREIERFRLAPDRAKKPFNRVIQLFGMNTQQTH